MILSEKLISSFFSSWHQETGAADNFNSFLDISDDVAAELYDLAHEYTYYTHNKQYKNNNYYFERAASLTKLRPLIEQLNVDNKNCYFASIKCVTFLFTRNKNAFVDNMNKMWYTNGWLPVHKKTLHYPKKKIYSAFYFTNVIGYTPTKN